MDSTLQATVYVQECAQWCTRNAQNDYWFLFNADLQGSGSCVPFISKYLQAKSSNRSLQGHGGLTAVPVRVHKRE